MNSEPNGDDPRRASPPRWADAVLRMVLRPEDVEPVSGDLIEEYRESVRPSRGRLRADVWFIGQVSVFAGRASAVWACLFAALMLGRTALDWFVPPADFMTRSAITTYSAIGLFVACGVVTSYRTRSIGASAIVGWVTGLIAAPIRMGGTLLMLAIWHDPWTRAAIAHSGGLGEVFSLPVLLLLPGALLASLGGVVGTMAARLRPR